MCDKSVGSNLQPLGLLFNISTVLWDPNFGSAACLPHMDLMGQEGGRSPVGHTPNTGWPATPTQATWEARALSLTFPQQQVLT